MILSGYNIARVGFGVGFYDCRHAVQKRRKPKTRWGSRLFNGAASQI